MSAEGRRVAIIGRPNVGKSTLFNRIIGRRQAIVAPETGITRDRLVETAEWQGADFTLVDTGGLNEARQEAVDQAARQQALSAVETADLILLVGDAADGLTPEDETIAEILRRRDVPIIVVVNKVDGPKQQGLAAEFYQLGFGEPVPVSAEHGRNTGDLLDRITAALEAPGDAAGAEQGAVRVAVVGRPNAGKSTLVNTVLERDRVIVDAEPGTTRDAVDVSFRRGEQRYVLIDTAGMRRKARVDDDVEYYSVNRAVRAIQRADVVVLMLDASTELAQQDERIAGLSRDRGKPMILAVNKWDLMGGEASVEEYAEYMRWRMPHVDYAPAAFVSALHGDRVDDLLDLVWTVYRNSRCWIPARDLDEVIRGAMTATPPPGAGGERVKVYGTRQAEGPPPTFVLETNRPDDIHYSYRRYLKNRLREAFDFEGTPVVLSFRSRSRRPS